MIIKKKRLLSLGTLFVLTGILLGPAQSAAAAGVNYGTFRIQADLGAEPPAVPPIIDSHYAGPAQGFTLSDETHTGTFDANFRITAKDKPAYDTFKVHNDTDLPMVFGYTHEDQNILPVDPARNMTDLQACFNALCDAGIFFPANTLPPPVPLGIVPANTTTEFKVGMKLSPFAQTAHWKGTSLTTTLYFKDLLSLQ